MSNVPTADWTVDPDDPRAPPQAIWDALTPEQRRKVVAALPSEPFIAENPPEGDDHLEASLEPRTTLRRHFGRSGRRVYIGNNLAVYYPGEKVFSPDLLAVLDVDPHKRDSWIVNAEGKGLDFVLEVHVAGDWRKDFQMNVERYARLGIAEYFAFSLRRQTLVGHRLEGRAYVPAATAAAGRLVSRVLDLELAVDGDRVRFFVGDAPLPHMDELVGRLETGLTDAVARQRDLEHVVEEQQGELERLRAENERLRRGQR